MKKSKVEKEIEKEQARIDKVLDTHRTESGLDGIIARQSFLRELRRMSERYGLVLTANSFGGLDLVPIERALGDKDIDDAMDGITIP